MPAEGALLFAAERAGALLLIAALLAFVLRPLPRLAAVGAVAVASVMAAFIPLRELTPVDLLFSMIGPLSAAGLLLVGSQLVRHLTRGPPAGRGVGMPAMAFAVVVLGVAFYPPAMGLGRFDPYALGYAGWAVPVVLIALSALGVLFRAPAILVWVALSAAIFLAGLSPSRNLWDSVLDPVGWFAALILIGELAVRRRKRRRGAPPQERERSR